MYSEDQLLPISALQHLLFCERQCALIHIERLWAENRLTVEGRHLHDKAHGRDAGPRGGGLDESRRGPNGETIRIARGVPLRSLRLGLFGVADVVEFHTRGSDADGGKRDSNGAAQSPAGKAQSPAGKPPSGREVPFPVEYKRGRPKRDDCDRVQVCAQALCLEEMLAVAVPRGALYYGRTRHRQEVTFDESLRQKTAQAAARLHELIAAGRTPTAAREPKCKRCSLLHLCLPGATGARRSALGYVRRSVAAFDAGALEVVEPDAGGVCERRFDTGGD